MPKFISAQAWGNRLNTMKREGGGLTTEQATKLLHEEDVYKDIRTPEDIEKGVKPEAKYPELSKAAK